MTELDRIFEKMKKESRIKVERFQQNYLLFSKRKVAYIEFKHKEKKVLYCKLYWCERCPVIFVDKSMMNSDNSICPYCNKRSYQLNGATITIVKPEVRGLENVTIRK